MSSLLQVSIHCVCVCVYIHELLKWDTRAWRVENQHKAERHVQPNGSASWGRKRSHSGATETPGRVHVTDLTYEPGKLSGKLWTHLWRVTDWKRIYWVSIPNQTYWTGKLLCLCLRQTSCQGGHRELPGSSLSFRSYCQTPRAQEAQRQLSLTNGARVSRATGTEPMQTETGRAGGAGRGWAGDHFWSGAAFTVRSKDNKVSFLSQRFKRASELTRWKAGNSGLKPVKTIGLGLGILCSVLTAKDGTGTVVMACPAWLPELRDAAASSPRCDHRHTRVSPSHRCWAWGTWRVSGQRGSHTGWSRAWVSPKQSGPRVQVTTRMLRQGAQTRETEGSHHCARGIPEQRATDTRGKRRDSNLGPRSRKTCHLHPQTEAQETAGTKATFSFTRS